MKILNDCFNDLDEDGSHAIGIDELEDPLIALGLVDSREQVEEMVKQIDDDCNIEFNEFLQLVKGGKKMKQKLMKAANSDNNDDADIIFNFFKKLTDGDLQPSKHMKIGFGVYYSQERRKKILSAILGKDGNISRHEGQRILGNYRQQLTDQMKRVKQTQREMQEAGEQPPEDEIDMVNFMRQRADAFERNELDPESLKSHIDDLKKTRGRHGV